MQVACRWPGGMTLMIPRFGGNPLTIHVNGPSGKPSVLPAAPGMSNLPSKYVATTLHKKVADTVKRMQDTSGLPIEETEYGVTEVPDQFWNAWLDAHSEFDVVKHRMVFAL